MTKRLDGEGTIGWHIGSGRYQVKLQKDGRRISRYAKTQKEAKDILRDLQRKQEDGILIANAAMPMKNYLREWLEIHKNQLKPSVYKSYQSLVEYHLIPRFGKFKLNKISPMIISKAWEDMIQEGYSAHQCQASHRRLSKALNDAVRRGLISRNPCQYVTTPKPETKEKLVLKKEQVIALLEEASKTDYYSAIFVALYTGMRRSELLSLRWKDIDLTLGVIYLNQSIWVDEGKVHYITPKTKSGRRAIPLTPNTVIHLRQELEKQMSWLNLKDDSHVFVNAEGSLLLPNALTKSYKRIVRRIGLDGLRFHDLRHSHATLMLMQGVHPKVVQERLGHSKISTTMDIYSHVMPSLQQEAAEKFDLAIEELKS